MADESGLLSAITSASAEERKLRDDRDLRLKGAPNPAPGDPFKMGQMGTAVQSIIQRHPTILQLNDPKQDDPMTEDLEGAADDLAKLGQFVANNELFNTSFSNVKGPSKWILNLRRAMIPGYDQQVKRQQVRMQAAMLRDIVNQQVRVSQELRHRGKDPGQIAFEEELGRGRGRTLAAQMGQDEDMSRLFSQMQQITEVTGVQFTPQHQAYTLSRFAAGFDVLSDPEGEATRSIDHVENLQKIAGDLVPETVESAIASLSGVIPMNEADKAFLRDTAEQNGNVVRRKIEEAAERGGKAVAQLVDDFIATHQKQVTQVPIPSGNFDRRQKETQKWVDVRPSLESSKAWALGQVQALNPAAYQMYLDETVLTRDTDSVDASNVQDGVKLVEEALAGGAEAN